MAKASDLMGRSGAGGMNLVGASPFKPGASAPAKPGDRKPSGKAAAAGGKPTVGHQPAGGGRAPVARRPKV
jgi:hypothetical protein